MWGTDGSITNPSGGKIRNYSSIFVAHAAH
jgi:hypothetical protein